MTTTTGRGGRLAKLTELIEDIRIAMLTTAMPDGRARGTSATATWSRRWGG